MNFNSKNRLFLAALFLVHTFICDAQTQRVKIKFGDVKPGDFAPAAYEVDSSAEAVYLFDGGKNEFFAYEESAEGIYFNVRFTKHTRIRLLKKGSFEDLGKVEIPLEMNLEKNYQEKLIDFRASTYNLENGNVVETKIDKKTLIEDAAVKHKGSSFIYDKFTFPDLKEGSIIEYTYTIEYPGIRNLETWNFQGKYPRIWSEYEILDPEFYNYIISRRGYIKYSIDTGKSNLKSYDIKYADANPSYTFATRAMSATTNDHLWAIKNVPAIKPEPFITTLDNYTAGIDFQLYYVKYPNEPIDYYTKSWPETVSDLMIRDNFGKQFNDDNNWISDEINAVAKDAMSPLEEAKKIYEYVRDHYSCTGRDGIYLSQTLKNTFESKQGSIADINMLLTLIFLKRNFTASPVILSTRDNGVASETTPILNEFNYVVSKVTIDGKDYLLDASDGGLSFGNIAPECYNGSGRSVSTPPALIPLSADSIKDTKITSVFIFNGDKEMQGNYTSTPGYYDALDLRHQFEKTNMEDYFSEVKKNFSYDINLSNTKIDSLKTPDAPLSIKYDFQFPVSDDIIYFNPMFSESIKENPFKSEDRFYPVQMPYCTDEIYTITMEIPSGYNVDELPKSARINLNENDGTFEYLIQKTDNSIQMRCRLKLNKANFPPEDYKTLRDFYAFIVQKENEEIIFKKNK